MEAFHMETNRVDGSDPSEVTLFTLSTCIWCKKTKALLKEMDVSYQCIDVDLLEGAEREKALDELKRFNPRCSFPSLVVNHSTCIIGFDEPKIKEALKR
jgi:glutaredoxin-like protein NrdH